MATEPVQSRTVAADVFLPADGLRLLGQGDGSGYAGRRFLVGRSDGEIIRLPLLPYLIMAAIAEGGVDGGWTADQVGTRVGAASGQRLTADTVRYLTAGELVPLGLIAGGGTVGRVLSWPIVGCVDRLLPPQRRRRWTLAVVAAAALVCVAATAPIMAETGNRKPDRTGLAPAAVAADAASRLQAAAWVAQQVSPDVTVSCDPGMCRQLQRDGFPAARLEPVPRSVGALLGSGIVVATAAVRSQFGPRLAAVYAPGVIAGFGSGAARVDVRVTAPAGPAAFAAGLAAEQTALASAGRQLLGNENIQASPSARTALAAGRVDARLLSILALLSAQLPVRLVVFTGAPGAGAGVPLRGAEIGAASPAARSAVVALLDAQQGPYRPAATTVIGGGGRALVAVRFDAPAELSISQP